MWPALMAVATTLLPALAAAAELPDHCGAEGTLDGYGCASLRLPAGTIRGNRWVDGLEFLTVPYARHRRFEPPTILSELPVSSGFFDATNILPLGQDACMQPGPPFTPGSGKAYGVEDCLILNLYVPRSKGLVPRPILVWIFGGDNTASEIIPYNATKLAGRHDAIVAVVSYRLGALGFAAFEEDLRSHAPTGTGNNGMHDVLAAISWLREQHTALGADPDRLVVFGESSGATDAQILSMVPHARGLVHGSIAESGGLYAQSIEDAIRSTREVGRAAGCIDPPEGLKKCMINGPADRIVNASKDYDWGPTVDGVFLPEQPAQMLAKGHLNPGVSVLWGANTNDSAMPFLLDQYVGKREYVEYLNSTINGNGGPPEEWFFSGRKKISGYRHKARLLTSEKASYHENEDDLGNLLQRGLELYPPKEFGSNSVELGWFMSDQFICSTHHDVLKASKAVTEGGRAFLYRFDWFFQSHESCIADSNYHTPRSGSNHCDEMTFVYGQPIFDNQDPPGYSYTNCSDPSSKYFDKRRCVGCVFDEREAVLSLAVGHHWTSFARYGHPIGEIKWPAFNASSPRNIVLHPDATRVESNLGRPKACDFWDAVQRNLYSRVQRR